MANKRSGCQNGKKRPLGIWSKTVTVGFCRTVIVCFSKRVCASVRKRAHASGEKRKKKHPNYLLPSESLREKYLPGNHIITTTSTTFRKLASCPTSGALSPASHKHTHTPPRRTSCRRCPLTSPRPCSGPETQRPAA